MDRRLATCLVVIMAAMISAQTLTPTDGALTPAMLDGNIYLSLAAGPVVVAEQSVFMLAPLTPEAGLNQAANALASLHPMGPARLIDERSVDSLASDQIAIITCDRMNASSADPKAVVGKAGGIRPRAIVMYSVIDEACILNGTFNYTSMYTTTSARDAAGLLKTVDTFPKGVSTLVATISSNGTVVGNGPSQGGPGPTTAVAMSILYSITGLITLLFLIIIGTGAIRAHRHPERYGPRGALAGRPRQSRAKGLARAMLETLPIVKFGDTEAKKPAPGDIELQNGASSASPTTVAHTNTLPEGANTASVAVDRAVTPEQAEAAVATSSESATNEVDLGCSICTEDFTTGEDVRVLPCNHKYHPACVDPWLLNVSGTCPLCRLDLRPAENRGEATRSSSSPPATQGDLAPPLSVPEAENGGSASHPGRLSRFLDLHRLRHAPPDERIAALRRFRQHSQQESDPAVAATSAATTPSIDHEERTRRARLTTRLRETFHIRTRAQHGADGPTLTAGVDV